MKKTFTLSFLLFCFMSTIWAQQSYVADNITHVDRSSTSSSASSNGVYFRFMAFDQSMYINEIDPNDAGKHFLGDYVAKKMFLLKKLYSYKEAVAPGTSATKTIFRKPDIYFSVKKIEKYLKEALRERQISGEDACSDYNKVLDVALNIVSEDTEKLETRINSVNGNPSKLLKIFVNEVELNK